MPNFLTSKDFGTMELIDAKIAKLLSDNATAAKYGEAVDLPSSLKITATPKIETKKRQGDSQTKDIYSRITEMEISVECSEFNLDALCILIGGAVTTTGAEGSITQFKYALNANNVTAPYFKLEGQWKYVNEEVSAADGDAHMIIYKCKCTDAPDFEIVDASSGFGTVKFKGIAIASKFAGDWYDMTINSVAAPIETAATV